MTKNKRIELEGGDYTSNRRKKKVSSAPPSSSHQGRRQKTTLRVIPQTHRNPQGHQPP